MAQPVPVWIGVVDKDGKLRLEARSLFEGYVKRLKNQPVQLVLKKLARRKSQSQLGYLFGVIYPILADHLGYMDYEIDAVHDACMRELRGLKPDPNPLQLRQSLKDMSHEEVSDYISDLRFWMLDKHGCVTPDAGKAEAA
jgi:hypothetical protein